MDVYNYFDISPYMTYTATSSNDSEAQRRHDEWQAYKKITDNNNMSSEVGYILLLISIVLFISVVVSILREKDKKMRMRLLILSSTVFILTLGILTSISFYRDHKKRSAPPMVNDTATGHQSENVEKTIHRATIMDAIGQTADAIDALEAAETNFPEAWSEAMEDPDLATLVQAVRDSWNEKTGNGGQ